MPRQTSKKKYSSLPGDGGWHTDETVMVGQYTQTRQRRLRAKTVKSGHGRNYKKRVLLWAEKREKGEKNEGNFD